MTKLTRKLWIALMHPLTAFFSAKLDSSLERAAPATKLAAELAGPDPDRRKLAAAQLSSLGLLALPALVAASRSKSLPARAHAVLLLGRIGSKSVLARRALHRIRERDPDRRIRWLARLSTGLAKARRSRAAQDQQGLSDSDPNRPKIRTWRATGRRPKLHRHNSRSFSSRSRSRVLSRRPRRRS